MSSELFSFRTGDWVFVNGSGWISNTIRAVTFSNVSHVGIMFDPEQIFETDIKWGKAKLNPIKKYEKHDVYVYRPPYAVEELAKIPAACLRRKGRRYSGFDIFTNLIFSPLHPAIRGKIVSTLGNDRFQICSEQVCDITHEVTKWKGLKNFESFTPDDALRFAQAKFEKVL